MQNLSTNEICNILQRANAIYYNSGSRSHLTDDQYDEMKQHLRLQAPDHPLLRQVGAPIPRDSMRQKCPHTHLVGSVQNSKDFDPEGDYVAGLRRWVTQGHGSSNYMVMPKLDGTSIRLYYENSLLVKALTRGDGMEGEDVTANAIMFAGVPLRLAVEGITCAIRGEAVLHLSDWPKLDPEKASNPRAKAAGAVRSDDPGAEHLTFYAFDIHGDSQPATFEKSMGLIDMYGVQTAPRSVAATIEDVIAYHTKIGSIRGQLDFLIDGIVVRVNDNLIAERLGFTDTCPKCMVAMKYPPAGQETEVTGIRWSVGHTGRLTPVALLKPVKIGGVEVSNANLFNVDEINRIGLLVGAKVFVVREGDVIPRIVAMKSSGPDCTQITIPTQCPSCSSPVAPRTNTDDTQTVDLYCENPACPAKAYRKVMNWIEKLDIQGIGDEVLDALMTYAIPNATSTPSVLKPIVTSIADLYRLNGDAEALSSLQINGKKLGSKRVASILAQIDKTRTLTIDQFLGSLGIVHLGRRRVQLIREAWSKLTPGGPGRFLNTPPGWFTHPNNFPASCLADYADKLGIPSIAASIQKDLDDRRAEIEELLPFITIKEPEASSATPVTGVLTGKSFCLTGAMSRTRDAIAADIVAAGGEIKDDVSGSLSYLVQADPKSESSKSKKAKKLNVPVIGEERLMALIGGAL